MNRYDAATGPPAADWLATPEAERIRLVEAYHRRERVKLPNATLHATIHVIVENQLALGDAAIVETFERLKTEGLTRHESLHAIGTVLGEHLFWLMKADALPESDLNEKYRTNLQRLTADGWRNLAVDEPAG